MGTRKLFTYLESFHPLSDNLKSFLNENLVPVSFPKRHILLEVPKVASHAYFLNDGFAMSYTFNKEGMITENFWKAGQLIVAFDSFIFQKPSFEVIQLVNPSDLLCLSYENMIEMFGQFPEALQIYYVLINQHCSNLLKRLRNLKTADHSKQYNELLMMFPEIERIVTQRAIASYLGITPQSLARIKRKDD